MSVCGCRPPARHEPKCDVQSTYNIMKQTLHDLASCSIEPSRLRISWPPNLHRPAAMSRDAKPGFTHVE